MDIALQKQLLREDMQKARDQIPRTERNVHAERICEQLWEIILSRKAQVIHTYLNMGAEINVLPLVRRLLDAGKTVVAPKTLKKRQLENRIVYNLQDMEAGVFGTYHPKGKKVYNGLFDLVIIPGLAFDRNGGRLGYGGGYYDTFLLEHLTSWKVGICYPNQLVEHVPVDEHDILMDQVIY